MIEFFDNTTPPVLIDDLALPEELPLLPLEQFCIPQAEEPEPVATLPPRLQQEFQSAKQASFFNMRVMKRKHGDNEISDELESPKRRQFGHGWLHLCYDTTFYYQFAAHINDADVLKQTIEFFVL